jgi:hypothetical protein
MRIASAHPVPSIGDSRDASFTSDHRRGGDGGPRCTDLAGFLVKDLACVGKREKRIEREALAGLSFLFLPKLANSSH